MNPLPHIRRAGTWKQRLASYILRLIFPSWRSRLYAFAIQRETKLGRALLDEKVARLPFGLVVKDCTNEGSVEADALRFLDGIRGVNAPLLLDHVSHAGKQFIVTPYVCGDVVGSVFDNFISQADRERLVLDLRLQFEALAQQTVSPGHAICNASGGPIVDPRIPWLEDDGQVFRTPPEFLKEVWCGIEWPRNRERLYPLIQPLIDRNGPDVTPVFCHGDLYPPNLILPGGLANWRAGKSRVCIIDWQMAGWMPKPWEALKATFLVVSEEDEWMPTMRGVFPDSTEYLDADWQWRLHSNVTLL